MLSVMGALLANGCVPSESPAKEWWVGRLSENRMVLHNVQVPAGGEQDIAIPGSETQRIGILEKQAEDLRSLGGESQFVRLEQRATGMYVGTFYSASNRLDLDQGNDFTVRNQRPVEVDVVVFLERER